MNSFDPTHFALLWGPGVLVLMVFTYGGFYSELTGRDDAPGALTPPRAWADTGYHGPVLGHPLYREES